MTLCPEPLARPAPLSFAVTWIVLATGFLAFMWGGVVVGDTGFVIALSAFGALCAAAGAWLLRSALGWRRFVRTFGTPAIHSAPATGPGDPLQLVVRFASTWPAGRGLTATATWVARDDDGDPVQVFERQPLAVAAQRAGAATMVRVSGLLPLASPAARAGHACLELHLLDAADARRGWRIRLPDIPVPAMRDVLAGAAPVRG